MRWSACDLPIDLLVVGSDEPMRYRPIVRAKSLEGQVHFLPPRSDIEFYYAAADAYAGPSLEDTFAQPPAEAMACGLAVIVSTTNGTSEIITDGKDGLILSDPTDAISLSAMIRRLFGDKRISQRPGVNASETARQYTWERNGRELTAIFKEFFCEKHVLSHSGEHRNLKPVRKPGVWNKTYSPKEYWAGVAENYCGTDPAGLAPAYILILLPGLIG